MELIKGQLRVRVKTNNRLAKLALLALTFFMAVLLTLVQPLSVFSDSGNGSSNAPGKESGNNPAHVVVPLYVNINSNTGTFHEETLTVLLKDNALPGDVFKFEHKQFELIGWTTYPGVVKSAADIYPAGAKITGDFWAAYARSHTIYAQWKIITVAPATYSVVYSYVGDVPKLALEPPAKADYEAGVVVQLASRPSLEGYEFFGWYMVEPFDNNQCLLNDDFRMPAANVNLVGLWKEVPDVGGDDNGNGGNGDSGGSDNGDSGGNDNGDNGGDVTDPDTGDNGSDATPDANTERNHGLTSANPTVSDSPKLASAQSVRGKTPQTLEAPSLPTPAELTETAPLRATIKDALIPLISGGSLHQSGSMASVGFGAVQFLVGAAALVVMTQSGGGSSSSTRGSSRFLGLLTKGVAAVGVAGPVVILLTTDVMASSIAMPAFDISALPMMFLTIAQVAVMAFVLHRQRVKPKTATKTLYRQ